MKDYPVYIVDTLCSAPKDKADAFKRYVTQFYLKAVCRPGWEVKDINSPSRKIAIGDCLEERMSLYSRLSNVGWATYPEDICCTSAHNEALNLSALVGVRKGLFDIVTVTEMDNSCCIIQKDGRLIEKPTQSCLGTVRKEPVLVTHHLACRFMRDEVPGSAASSSLLELKDRLSEYGLQATYLS